VTRQFLLRRRFLLVWGLITLLVAGGLCANAQSTSTISGSVLDKLGAVVPGASVLVKNQDSGDERKTVTTRDGHFAIPALHAGTYIVSATAKGFGTYVVTDIVLNAQDAKSIEITLPLAEVTDSVTVSAKQDSSIVVEDSGAKSETITGDDLQNMTMGTRNAAEIVKLMSGAMMSSNSGMNKSSTTNIIGMNSFTPAGTAAGLGNTKINGQAVDLTMDGGHDFDPGSAGANTPINPNMDMISELTVLSSSFSAEYEHGPVVVNVETKGGGSKYHGQVHFYAQNSALNAVESEVKINKTAIMDTHQYYPGGQVSGPMPSIFGYNKKRDKLFFFDGFESYRQLMAPGLMEAVVPTTAMYSGDFTVASNPGLRSVGNLNPSVNSSGYSQNVPVFSSNQSYTPLRPNCTITQRSDADPTGGGLMSAGCISSAGQALMKAYFDITKDGLVDPATHSGWNYVKQTTASFNQWQNVARVDWSISDKTKAYVRINTSRESANNPMGVWGSTVGTEVVPAPTIDVAANTADSIAGSLTQVFSPSLTSETTISWTKVTMPNKPGDPSKISRSAIGLPEAVFGQDTTPSFSNWSSGFPALGPGGNYVRKPLAMKADKLTPSAKENVTKVLGAHTLKAGVFYEFILNKQDPYGSFNGFMQVPQGWGQDTGNAYATMLMGINGNNYSETQDTPIIGDAAQQLRFYVNDHWKVTRRLTVDLGLRFDHMGKPYTTGSTNMGLAIWNENLYNNNSDAVNDHTGVSWHGKDPTIPLSGVKSRMLFYSPRFGLAYDLFGTSKTIVRGGLGMFYAYDNVGNDQYTGAKATAWGAGNISCSSTDCPTFETLNGDTNAYLKPYSTHVIPAGIPAGLQQIDTIDPKEDDVPHVMTYNMQIDQKLPWKFMLEASYVGNYGDGNQYRADINAVKVGRISKTENLACLKANNCDYDAGHDSSGVYWRPRVNYKTINESIIAGKSQYDGLQVSAHRSSGILFLLTNFTWAKAYANNAVANGGSYSSLADHGNSEYWGVSRDSRKLTFNASYTVTEPRIHVKNGILDRTANGWQISGVTQFSSGVNLVAANSLNFGYGYGNDTTVTNTTTNGKTTTTSVATATHDNIALIGANSATIFPTMICDPRVHQKVAATSTMPFGGRRFLNPACFAPTTSGLGNSHIPYFPGPTFFNSDLAVMKTVKINERQGIEFKFQAFNFLNHPLWSFNSSDTNLALSFNGQTTTDGVITQVGGKLASSSDNFGVAAYRFGHRYVQMEARYWF